MFKWEKIICLEFRVTNQIKVIWKQKLSQYIRFS